MTIRLPLNAFFMMLVAIAVLPRLVHAQNLVLNGDFETYTICPVGYSAFPFDPTFTTFPVVPYWVRPTDGSSDYFHTCASVPVVGVPSNTFGYRQPRSGKAYAGMYGYLKTGASTVPYREFISTKLPARMKKDSSYCVSFFVSTAARPSSAAYTVIAANSVAAYISDTLPTTIPTLSSDPPRFIMNDTNVHLTDTNKWYEVSGNYRAKGGEQWITIGVFYDGAIPPFSYLSGSRLDLATNYIYIDDVTVKRSNKRLATKVIQYCGDPVMLTAGAAAGPYSWSTGETSRSITATAPGTYDCSTPDTCGNIHEPFVLLPVPVSDTVTEQKITVCRAEGLNLKLMPAATGTRYKWSSGETTREITARTTGSYSCEVLSNCRVHLSKFEVINGMPELPVLQDTTVCQYIDSPILQTAYTDLIWFSEKGAGPFSMQPLVNTREQGQVLLYASRKQGNCITARVPLSITIRNSPPAQLPQEVLRCSDRLNDLEMGQLITGDYSYEWSTGEISPRIPVPPADGRYFRTVKNSCGIVIDTFNLRSGLCNDCLVFPNAFTPNNDGHNDGFYGLPRCQLTEYLLRIYNRWGETIFVTSKPETEWDGTHKGTPAPFGTYMYQCTFRNRINGENLRVQGDVLLIR